MKFRMLAISALIALLAPGLIRGQTNTGFPQLPPVPKTGQLSENPGTTQFTFIVAGDNRPQGKTPIQPKTLSQLLNDAQRFKPAFFLWCGDTISGHTADGKTLKKQYDAFILAASKANVPIFNAPGNHEMDTVFTDPSEKTTIEIPNSQMLGFYLQYMRDPSNTPPSAYGAFNYGNSRFIAMNTEEVAPPDLPRSPGRVVASGLKLDPGYVTQEQIELVKQDLAANNGKSHIFVFMHHPIKPDKTPSGLDSATAANLAGIFQNNSNVSYVLAAHEHLYYNANSDSPNPPQWTPGTSPIYLVTGGAGAPLDKCGTPTPNTYCDDKSYHYLVFTVDGTTVNVQVVSLQNSPKKSPKKNRGKK
jgi:Calcineurin-like phosphoesterase